MTIGGLLWAMGPYAVAFFSGDVLSQTLVRWRQLNIWMRTNNIFAFAITATLGLWTVYQSLEGTYNWFPFLADRIPEETRRSIASLALYLVMFGFGCRWGYGFAYRVFQQVQLKKLLKIVQKKF